MPALFCTLLGVFPAALPALALQHMHMEGGPRTEPYIICYCDGNKVLLLTVVIIYHDI